MSNDLFEAIEECVSQCEECGEGLLYKDMSTGTVTCDECDYEEF